MTTQQGSWEHCPLCIWAESEVTRGLLPYHLAIAHNLFLDLSIDRYFFQGQIQQWDQLRPFQLRDPHES